MPDDRIIDELDKKIRRVPDFPKKGILFYDLTTLLQDSSTFHKAIDLLADKVEKEIGSKNFQKVVSIESRGFILGSPLAYKFKKGFVIVRKEGKLPYETLSYSYGLEYGTATVEIHTDAIEKGESVIVVDDLIATGGTISATIKLVEDLGGKVVGSVFLVELVKLGGRKIIESKGIKVVSIISYG